MLMSRNLPKYLWAEALHHANNTFNNIPKESHSPSPKEKFFGESFDHPFIEFGVPVFHTTNPVNRSKLAERGSPGIFLGFDHHSKGFRIFTDGKIRIERHVKFLKEKKNIEPNVPSELLHNDDEDLIQPSSQNVDQFVDEALAETEPLHEPLHEPRRSERIRSKQANTVSTPQTLFEPKTYKQAISCPDKDKWIKDNGDRTQKNRRQQ
jgi:hypothetical protein